jgi:hypothetical protein
MFYGLPSTHLRTSFGFIRIGSPHNMVLWVGATQSPFAQVNGDETKLHKFNKNKLLKAKWIS